MKRMPWKCEKGHKWSASLDARTCRSCRARSQKTAIGNAAGHRQILRRHSFRDADDGHIKRDTVADIVTTLAGDGIKNTSPSK